MSFHPYYKNIDNSKRIETKKGDYILFSDSKDISKYLRKQAAVVIERYKTLNQYNKQYWNYFSRVKLLTGNKVGKERVVLTGLFHRKLSEKRDYLLIKELELIVEGKLKGTIWNLL